MAFELSIQKRLGAGRPEKASPRIELSDHALIRCHERQIPGPVLEAILEGGFVAQALEDDGRVSNFRIVRVASHRYWVGIERDAVLVTVIPVGFEGMVAYEWFRRRLLGFRHVIGDIETLPITSTRRLARLHTPPDQPLTTGRPARRRDRVRGRTLLAAESGESFGAAWHISA